MNSLRSTGWERLGWSLGVILWPAIARAHGGLDGIGAFLVGVFLGIPCAISMVLGTVVCGVIAWKQWYGRRALVVGWVLMIAALLEVVALPVAAVLVERRFTSDSATYTLAFTIPLLVLAAPCFLLARRVVRRSRG